MSNNRSLWPYAEINFSNDYIVLCLYPLSMIQKQSKLCLNKYTAEAKGSELNNRYEYVNVLKYSRSTFLYLQSEFWQFPEISRDRVFKDFLDKVFKRMSQFQNILILDDSVSPLLHRPIYLTQF